MEQELEEKKKKKKKKGLTYNPLYHREDFIERLGSLVAKHKKYSIATRELNQEFNSQITPQQVKNIYVKNMANKIVKDEGAKEFFEDSFKQMKKRWKEAWNMVGDLIYHYNVLKEQSKDRDDTEQALFFIKMTPTIIQIAQEIRKQLEHIQKQQEQIKVNQQNFIYSPIQINQHLHKVFKNWIQQGYIKVMKQIPEFKAEGNISLEDDKKTTKQQKEEKTND